MPRTGEGAAERFISCSGLSGMAEAYLHRRGVPLETAEAAGLRFDADFAGRPALVAPLMDQAGRLKSLHGRYLQVVRGQGKMFTFGEPGGVIQMLDGVQAQEPILVEGLFDALSVAACGWPCVATIGRWAPWLADAWSGRAVWLAFDAGRPGEAEVVRYGRLLADSRVRRMLPPPRCKDWNTALVKRGPGALARWLRESLAKGRGSA